MLSDETSWQWGALRERYAAELLAPRAFGSDPVDLASPPGMDSNGRARVRLARRPARAACVGHAQTGTVGGLVVTAALLDDEELFVGASRRELFD